MPTQSTDTSDKNSLSKNKNTCINNKKSNKSKKNTLDFKKYTQQIWLAGLGAFSRAEEESSKLFENLVKIGEEFEKNTRNKTDEDEKSNHSVQDLKDKGWDQKLQQSFNKLGLASHKDIHILQQLILQLDAKLDHLIEENQQLKQQLQNKP
ncbi:phasin family protein [uncultured Acinetobacter sp.]|uniref:phasin family protein n=1 Tax=uncultured Acinetobacter sp. TaxID=165433 RepID=UPI002634C33B|nr:phasin family protein [uncultured Acinetobacter sp.]